MVKHLIGDDFGGVLGSDFYAGYNIHQGLHQRCWVHFLRDGHELKDPRIAQRGGSGEQVSKNVPP